MSDWINQVVRIEKIVKHPDADNLSIAYIMTDYPVIMKNGQYQVDQLVGYISLESIVPDTQEFHFLCPVNKEQYEENGEIKSRIVGPKYPVGSVPEKYRRIKAKKIRGIYSQGLLIGLPTPMNEGDSIVELFGLKKFEEEEEDNITNAKKGIGANAEKPPSGWSIPYYDISSVRKYLNCIGEDEEIVLTCKLHGSNSAFCHDGERLWTKSRNYYKKLDPDDAWWDIAIRYNLEEKLSKFPMMVFFGEMYGQVKNFRYDCEIVNGKLETKVRFFDIWDTVTKRYISYDSFIYMVDQVGLETVPLLYRGKWKGRDEMYPLAEGKTTLGGKHVREGWVLKPVIERYEPRLDSRLILKLVGEGYNLAK